MKLASALLAASCWLSAALAVQPSFDAREVVRQVRCVMHSASRVEQGLDDCEFLIDTSITYVPAPGNQVEPALAFDGTNFLVVWTDGRSGSYYDDIYGARVTPAGTVLDTNGIAISTAADDQWSPALVFDGTNFLVVWADKRSGSYSDIYGARVTAAGVVLDPSGIAISTAAHDQWLPALSFDGTDFLVVWVDKRSGPYSDIYGARVTAAGVVLDPSGIAVSTAASYQWDPALAFDGTNFLVVWQDSRSGSYDIYGARVTAVGVVLDPSGIAISTAADEQSCPVLAFDGTNFLAVWQDYRSGSDDIYGARVTLGGRCLTRMASPSQPQRTASGLLALPLTARISLWSGETGAAVLVTSTERG